jgi:hypothetical protein
MVTLGGLVSGMFGLLSYCTDMPPDFPFSLTHFRPQLSKNSRQLPVDSLGISQSSESCDLVQREFLLKSKLQEQSFTRWQCSHIPLKVRVLLARQHLLFLIGTRVGHIHHTLSRVFSKDCNRLANSGLLASTQDPLLMRAERVLDPALEGGQVFNTHIRVGRLQLL